MLGREGNERRREWKDGERERQDPGFGGLCEISVSAEGCLRSKLG